MPVLPGDSCDPIPWVAVDDLACTPCTIDPALVARAASQIADNLSGNRFGQRCVIMRPFTRSPSCGCDWWTTWPPIGVTIVPGGIGIGCGCRVDHLMLDEPVWSVSEVWVDGALLDTTAWALWNDSRLVRLDGGDFPAAQLIGRDAHADQDTCEVSCLVGNPPDDAARMAVNQIACELVNAIEHPDKCQLPKRVQSVTRQQLAIVFPDPSVLARGFTGLPLVDLWLGSLDAAPGRRGGQMVDLSRMSATRSQ